MCSNKIGKYYSDGLSTLFSKYLIDSNYCENAKTVFGILEENSN